MDVQQVSRFLGVLALVAGPGGVVLLAVRRHPALGPVREHAVWLAGAVAATAMLGSLYYSEIAGFVPCRLCWWQRGFMYPLALLLPGVAWRGAHRVRPWAAAYSLAGLGVSTWHVLLQRVPSLAGTTSCSVESPCTAAWVEVFGVLTIPAMAACGFLAIAVLLTLPRAARTATPTVTHERHEALT